MFPSRTGRRRVLLLALAVALAACAPPGSAALHGGEGGQLVIGLGYEPSHFDPHAGNSYDQQYIHMNLFDPLVWRAPDGTFVPGLAERWDVSDDATAFTFHLRRGVSFHDGTPFDAEALKFTFDRITAPDFPSFTARGLMGPYAGSEVIDSHSLRVSFSQPYPPFLDALTQWWIVPVSPAAVRATGDDFGQYPVGTGPFMWGGRVHQDHVRLVRNPNYNWAPSFFEHQGPARLESVMFKFIPQEASRVGTLESGEIHVAQDVPPVDIQRLADDPAFVLHRVALPGMPTLLMINTEGTPTADPAVRQALQWATPKQQIIDSLWGGMFEPAYGPLSPGLLGYDPGLEAMYGYDPERARQILEAAGWVDANGDGIREKDGQPLRLRLNSMAFNRYPEVLQVPIDAWRQVGIDASLTIMTWPQFSGAGWAGEHSLMSYFTPASDPYFVTTAFYHSRNISNGFAFTRLRDPELDALLDEGARLSDEAARGRAYRAAAHRIMEQAAVLPLYVPYNLTMSRAEVQGLKFSAQGWYALLYDVYIEE
jgi:peptide/nickel transport system substrate-binding protein